MSKRDFKKWFESYRSVTEVSNQGVDQWEYEDVEIAYTEGLWQGRINACDYLLKHVVPDYDTDMVEKLNKSIKFFQRKLDRALNERGVRYEDEVVCDDKYKKSRLRSKKRKIAIEVALSKFNIMSPKKRNDVLDRAMNKMELFEYSKKRAIACVVADDLGMELKIEEVKK